QRDHHVTGRNQVRFDDVIQSRRAFGAVTCHGLRGLGARAAVIGRTYGDYVGIVSGRADRGIAFGAAVIVFAHVCRSRPRYRRSMRADKIPLAHFIAARQAFGEGSLHPRLAGRFQALRPALRATTSWNVSHPWRNEGSNPFKTKKTSLS